MVKTNTKLSVFAFFLSLGFTSPAFAYLDPGTGSMILQLLLGGIAGGLVIAKLYWQKLKGVFGAKIETSSSEPEDK